MLIVAFMNLKIEKQVHRLLVFLHLPVGAGNFHESSGTKTLFSRFNPVAHWSPFWKGKSIGIWVISFCLLLPEALLDLFFDALSRRQTAGVCRHSRVFEYLFYAVHFFKQVELTRPTKRVKGLRWNIKLPFKYIVFEIWSGGELSVWYHTGAAAWKETEVFAVLEKF